MLGCQPDNQSCGSSVRFLRRGDRYVSVAVDFSGRRPRMADAVHLTEKNFDETLAQYDGLIMVDFWAEWCGPCRAIAPVLEELARDSAGRITLAKVNVDENHGLAARYAIRSIPTVLFVRQGKVVDQLIGAVPKAKIKEKLDALA